MLRVLQSDTGRRDASPRCGSEGKLELTSIAHSSEEKAHEMYSASPPPLELAGELFANAPLNESATT